MSQEEARTATNVERRLSVLNPDGVTFRDYIEDRAELSALLDRIVAVIDVYGIKKIGCCVDDDEDGRLDIVLTCVKPGPAGDALEDFVWGKDRRWPARQ